MTTNFQNKKIIAQLILEFLDLYLTNWETDHLTLVNRAQGKADRKLIIHINRIIFFAFPMEDLERGDKGRQMARYLKRKACSLFMNIVS